jgi:DNA-binding SARP family transcriptional activator/TolB-like protein/tetratricopeptide (TPR) repeat protein
VTLSVATTLGEARLFTVGPPFVAGRRRETYIRIGMLELSLLGLHALRGSDGQELSSLLAQPKRFALLAYLAIGGGGGYHRRDSLAAMFWPDLDQFAARRALRNTLYHLREALGDGVIIVRGDDAVSIDPGALTCDVTRLADAVSAARYEEAVDCYRGELLAGVHFANAGEAFEEWLSHERLRVTGLVMGAIRALVEREELAGNHPAAARLAQRACGLAPDDEGWLRRGMSLLERAGDTGGALRLYETYVRRLATEFHATPSAETEALATRIRRADPTPLLPRVPMRPAALPSGVSDAAPPRVAAPATDGPVEAPHGRATRVTRPTRARRAAIWVGVGAAAVVGVLALAAVMSRHARPGVARARVLIAVFDNQTGDGRLQSFGRMTQDWLTQGVLRTHLVDVVDPRAVFVQGRAATGEPVDPITLAHRTGATMVVSGSYYRTGDTLLVQAAVLDVRAGRIVRVVGPILASVRSPVAALDALRSRVMTALASAVDLRATQDLYHTDEIPPFEAYQAYVEGWDAFWHGDGRRAEALFLQAAHRDTAFAAAAIAAASAASNTGDCALIDSLTRRLEARSQPLDQVDRLSLQIAAARCGGRNEEMLRLALERADLEPRASSDQLSAAAAALWANRPRQAVAVLERIDPTVDLAWSTDTTHFAYWSDLTEALHLLGRHREELAAADRLPPGEPLSRVWLRGRALAALSRPTAALALLDSSLALPVETASDLGLAPYTDGRPQYTVTPGWVANWIARELAVHGDTVAARQAAMRAVAWYRGRPAEERSTPEERLVASWSLEMLGSYPEAERLARQLVAEDPTNVDFRGELAGLAAERADTALADSLDRWLAAQPVARVSWSASVYRARVAALLGRRDAAVARTREAIDEGAWPLWIHLDPALATLRTRPDFVALTEPRD